MKCPRPIWECVYKHDRRKHRHRCFACRRIINSGENVVMYRQIRGTKAVHLECADRPIFPDPMEFTYRDLMWARGVDYLESQSWRVPKRYKSRAEHAKRVTCAVVSSRG